MLPAQWINICNKTLLELEASDQIRDKLENVEQEIKRIVTY